MKILLIKQTSLGDVLHATAAVGTLKKALPRSKITFLTDTKSYPLLKDNPKIDRFILIDLKKIEQNFFKQPLKTLSYILKIFKQTRASQYQVAFDLQGLFRSLVFLYFSKARQKIGKTHWPFTPRFKNKSLHAVSELKHLLAQSPLLKNIDTSLNLEDSMEYFLCEKAKKKTDTFLKPLQKETQPFVLLSPFTRWRSKDWTPQEIADFIKQIHASNKVTLFITGTPEQNTFVEKITQPLRSKKNQQNRIHNLLGNLTIAELAALMNRCNIVVSTDSFPAHLAGSLNKKLIVLFAPTMDERVGPLPKTNAIVLRPKSCEACYKRICAKNCMKKIKAKRVLNATLKMLSEKL